MGTTLPAGCCHVYAADGRCVALFKVLLTNRCTNDCYYCQNATSCIHRGEKTSFAPNELADLFLEFYKRNYVEGLFLSSGVCGDADRTMPDIIEVGRLLREVHGFQGYIHMKVLPGSSLSDIKALAAYADRISLNLEVPARTFLPEFSSTKDFNSDLLTRLRWMHGVNQREPLAAGLTTQVIVGGNAACDHDYLRTTNTLYSDFKLKRVYYSAFYPIEGSPLEHVQPTPMLHEHRLYQADWLLRIYRFKLIDVIPDKGENLRLDIDPKLNYALAHYADSFPIEVNDASYADLIRVPGIGPKSARRILSLRVQGIPIDRESSLRKIGAIAKNARPFISINGNRVTRLDEWAKKEHIKIST